MGGSSDSLSDFFDESEFGEDIFSILESLEDIQGFGTGLGSEKNEETVKWLPFSSQKSTCSSETEPEPEGTSPKSKKQKTGSCSEEGNNDGQQKMSHITVERNRRKQMNEHLSMLRSLMPCFYVKRGDQASIIGGVVDYINELQQVLQSLEAKKQRKAYSEVLSPRIVSSPRIPSPLSPRLNLPPISPRLSLPPISPRTPQPSSPYMPRLHHQGYNLSPTVIDPSPSSSSSSVGNANELVANSKSAVADVEVKFSGANVLLKTVSPRIQGQAMKIISALQELSLEILHASISTTDETMINSFTIKIGIDCQLSAEELAQQIQQTFC
ncbi:basic helix-loop-helix (bHLH) DNA-binding superfamily protein [Actinidia rufa]|uniref:Basic helix-loop-helix (BHLH) DNA-binding superfamily protein n=1 Tax=Actinidia rufa TaxID=165716 RepID=A0A7J0EAB1_9ERIC|nr:basic helix-loop-helix (bHLH) DNA-binding superfamily protein [Actinidia rufa]